MSFKRNASILGLALLVSDHALAHIQNENIDSFYNGLLHPVLVPAHLLLLIAVGLLLGQQGKKNAEIIVSIFVIATMVGLAMSWFSIGLEFEVLILSLSAAAGLLIAINPKTKSLWCTTIAALAGFSLGVDSAQETLFGMEKFLTLLGSAIAICFLLLYPMALADYFNQKTWQRVAVRVAGSWVTAISVLVLALAVSDKPRLAVDVLPQ